MADRGLYPENWNEVGDSDGPPFASCPTSWENFDTDHNSAAFYRDPFGVVHLKGLVKGGGCNFLFQLPAGYRPARREVHATLSNNQVARVNIGVFPVGPAVPGLVYGETGTYSTAWLSLDGITFRAGG